jgi:hypothetical protein
MRVHTSRWRLTLAMGVLGLAAVVVFWGRSDSLSRAKAEPPAPHAKVAPPSDYSQRVVAYIYNNTVPISREELGEYLIARMEPERLANLVNRRIIEHACKQRGIEVTNAEVEAEFQEMLKKMSAGGSLITVKDFVNKILKPRHKSLYEWKEDNIRPELLMSKLCRGRVKVTEEDLKLAYDAYYGEKVECRLILWPPGEKHIAMNTYARIRDSEEEFDRASRMQATPSLAASGGKITPIGRNTTGNEALEKAAFSLQKGELSQVIDTPDGVVVVKCLGRIPPDSSKTLEQVHDALYTEVFEKKLRLEIPRAFHELRAQANPKFILKDGSNDEELRQDVLESLQSTSPKPETKPHGNY